MRLSAFQKFLFLSIILFQIIFFIFIFAYYNIIIVPNSFFHFTSYNMWNFYVTHNDKNETNIIMVSIIIKILFICIFAMGLAQYLLDKKNAAIFSKAFRIGAILVSLTVYLICFFYIKYQVVHYRLFMSLISVEILSILLFLIMAKERAALNEKT